MYQVNKEKIEQAVNYLNQENIDMWIIYSSEGSDPSLSLITGIHTVGQTAFIFTKDNKKYSLCSIIDAQESEQSGLFDEVIKYRNGLGPVLKKLVDELDPKNIALNYSVNDNLCDGLTMGRYRWLEKTLGEKYVDRFISSEPFLKKLRSIKTPEEIRRIKKAVEITTDIYDSVFKKLKVGLSEYEVGQLFIDEMAKRKVVNGLTKQLTMPMVLKERIAHREPGDAIIEPGDFLIMDFSVNYEGYVSDIARTAYFLKEGENEAPKLMRDSFDAVYEAITIAKNTIKPGMKGYEIDDIARNHLLSKGMPEITHATGHQIGRATHDGGTLLGPRWERYGSAPYDTIEAGMLFTLEPTVLRQDDYSILTEENILVTDEGAEFISKRQKEIILIK